MDLKCMTSPYAHYKIDVSYLTARLLEEVLETVKRYSFSSYIKSFFNASERNFEITMLETRLLDSRIDILVSDRMTYCEVIS